MSIINRKRLKEWRRAVADVRDGRIALWAKLAMHIPKMRVCRSIWRKRMRACANCPIYHPVRKTCGHDPEITKIGCGCYMPFKAASTIATCWARDKGIIFGDTIIGWGDDINDISDMKDIRTCHTPKPLYMRGSDR